MDIETDGLAQVASDLAGAERAFTDVGGDLGALGAVADPNVQAGLEALTVAWGTALEVLAEDVSFVSGQVALAAALYDSTDGELAGHIYATVPGLRPPR